MAIVFLSQGYFQVIATIITIQCTVIALGLSEPFKNRATTQLEYFNEAVTLIWCYHMFIFTDFVADPRHRFQAGYILISLVGLCLFVNLAFLVMPPVRKAYDGLKMKYKRKQAQTFRRQLTKTKAKPKTEKVQIKPYVEPKKENARQRAQLEPVKEEEKESDGEQTHRKSPKKVTEPKPLLFVQKSFKARQSEHIKSYFKVSKMRV